MEGLDFTDLQGNNVNDFIKAYRDSLRDNYTANVNQIEQQRRNDEASIMANANRAGMMYSNFPARDKMKYEAETYLPNRQSAFTSYQTGLDKLRSNAVNAYNNIRSIEDAISDLNSSGGGGTGGNTGGNTGGDDVKYWGSARAQDGGTWFYDNNGNPVRFSTWAIKNGAKTSSDLLKYAQQALNDTEYNKLKKIYDTQSAKNRTFTRNTGKNYTNNSYDFLTEDENNFLNGLGIGF